MHLSAEGPTKNTIVIWEESTKVRSPRSKHLDSTSCWASWQGQTPHSQLGETWTYNCWEQLSLNTRAEAGDRAFIQRRQELRAEELVGSRRRFWVMKYTGNVWKSETKRPVGIVWLLVGNPPLAHGFVFLGTCSKPAFLPLKIYSKTEKDWRQHICLSSCREQPRPPRVD